MTGIHRVIWLDPGPDTGWAMLELSDGSFSSGQLTPVLLGEFLKRNLSEGVALGYEDFTVRPGSARMRFEPASLKVIGMADWLGYEYGATVWTSQASDLTFGMRFIKAVGWRKTGKKDANAAAAHLLSQCMQRNLLPRNLLPVITGMLETIGNTE